ncbi:ATP-binding cassette domain-containing protein [Devosia chinhatensis]|nr:ATP-binding cassette domain-containing protein [Devosia chinhatensis]
MLLEVDTFSLSFRRYEGLLRQKRIFALHDISFSLRHGQILALVGASGAGKSLLAHALFGILPPNASTTGTLRFEGETLDETTLRTIRGRRIGLVPQSISHLDPLVRCGHQLAWAAKRAGTRLDRAAITERLARFALPAEVARAFPHQLSGGMARRLLLAMATVGHPALVVADEPTSGLDAENASMVMAQLRGLADQGHGVLLITHDLTQAAPYSDSVAVLDGGRLVAIEQSLRFRGTGETLNSAYARALWRALPQNAFYASDDCHA